MFKTQQILTFCAIFLLFSSFVFGQKKTKIEFKEKKLDFGEIKEEDGAVTHVFEFNNSGEYPLILQSVKASCGCTTPIWSRDTVQAGEWGYIKAKFNPMNRPGHFNKTITVTANADPFISTLTIGGFVIPRIKGPKDNYPFEMGNLRFKTNHFAFSRIKDSDTLSLSTLVFNQGKKPIKISQKKTKLPPHLMLEMGDWTVPADTFTTLKLTYFAKTKGTYGFEMEVFDLVTNDDTLANKQIHASADIGEDFSYLDYEGKLNAPRAFIEKKVLNFGIQSADKPSTKSIELKNTGKSDLVLRGVKAVCSCLTLQMDREVIPAGESVTINVTFDLSGRTGTQRKQITLITNDPKSPILRIPVNAQVR